MEQLIIFGTVWFWVFVCAVFGGIVFALEVALDDDNDTGGGIWSGILLVLAVAAYYFWGSKEDVINIGIFLRDNPVLILSCFLGYIVVGLVWAFFKWYFFVSNKLEYHKKQKEKYKHHTFSVPSAGDNKFRIMSWMYFWPFSASWTLVNQPLKKSFKYVYEKTGVTFDKIAKKMFKSLVEQDVIDKEEIKKQDDERAEAYRKRFDKTEKGDKRQRLND